MAGAWYLLLATTKNETLIIAMPWPELVHGSFTKRRSYRSVLFYPVGILKDLYNRMGKWPG